MIVDNDPLISRFISTPKELNALNCAAFYCGAIESVLEANGYVRLKIIGVTSTSGPLITAFVLD